MTSVTTAPAQLNPTQLSPGRYQVATRNYVVTATRPGSTNPLSVAFVTAKGRKVPTARISADGHVYATSPRTKADLAVLLDDPPAAAHAYATATGRCSACGRELTDPESVAVGLGPDCRAKAVAA